MLSQPQSLPFDTASSTPVSPTARPIAPGRSNRPSVRSVLAGTSQATRANTTTPSRAAVPKSTCQSKVTEIHALRGRPTAPPKPSVALTRATAPPSRSCGRVSRRMLMASGMMPRAVPCRARPTTRGTSSEVDAATIDPTIMTTTRASTMRRLPMRSPRRPAIGVTTAPASRVAVMIHVVSAGSASSSSGNDGTIGMTSICMSAATSPENASTAVTTRGSGVVVRRRRCAGVSDEEPPGDGSPSGESGRASSCVVVVIRLLGWRPGGGGRVGSARVVAAHVVGVHPGALRLVGAGCATQAASRSFPRPASLADTCRPRLRDRPPPPLLGRLGAAHRRGSRGHAANDDDDGGTTP